MALNDIMYKKAVLNYTSASLIGVYAIDTVDTKELNVRDNVKVTGSVSMGRDLQVSRNTEISGTLFVSGNTNIENNITASGNVHVGKDATVLGKETVGGQGNFGGNLSTSGSLTVKNDVEIGGDIHLTGTIIIDSDLDVKGSGSFDKDLTTKGALKATKDTTLLGGLYVDKNVNILGTASIGGSGSIGGPLFVGSDTTINGNLTVNGTITKIGTEDLTIKDKLIEIASGCLSPQAADGAGIFISGANVSLTHSYIDQQFKFSEGLVADGNSKVNGTLNVAGNTSITGSITGTGNAIIDGNIEAKNANFNIITGSSISCSGDVVGSNLTLKSDASLTDLSASGIISASYYYGDGTDIYNVTCSIATCSMFRKEITIDAGQEVEVVHQFNNANVISQFYKYSGSETCSVVPPVLKIVDKNTISVGGFSEKVSGYVTIADAGHLIEGGVEILEYTTKRFEFNAQGAGDSVDCSHNFGTENILVSVYGIHDGITEYVIPRSIRILDSSRVRVIFGEARTGYIVIAKGGHIVSGSVEVDESTLSNFGVHRGTTGSWAANNYTVYGTMSAKTIVAGDYIDTTKVGNRTNGSYVGTDWGSYTEYSDSGITHWIIPEAGQEPDRVAFFTNEGDLFLKGSIYPNEINTLSDINLKYNVQTIQHSLEDLERVRGVEFDWKKDGKHSLGVIAQEIQNVYPDLVHKVSGINDEEGHLVVNYQGLIGVLIESVKELNNRVKYLESKLNN